MEAFFICGYRHTGKDELCRKFLTGKGYNWIIFSQKYKAFNRTFDNFGQFSFAHSLKKEVEEIHNIPSDTVDKNIRRFVVDGKTVSARDMWIKVAAERRSEDIDYFSRKLKPDNNYIITDWRYLNEIEFHKDNFDITTIRVFRKDVEIPGKDVESEHCLDMKETDFLFVDSFESFYTCKSLLPQYNDYIAIGKI